MIEPVTEDPCDPLGDIPLDVRCICIAYESGFGDGIDGRVKVNPYKASTKDWYAWNYGVRCGMRLRAQLAPSAVAAYVGYSNSQKCEHDLQERLQRENAELIAERDRLRGALKGAIECCEAATFPQIEVALCAVGVIGRARAALSGGEGK